MATLVRDSGGVLLSVIFVHYLHLLLYPALAIHLPHPILEQAITRHGIAILELQSRVGARDGNAVLEALPRTAGHGVREREVGG